MNLEIIVSPTFPKNYKECHEKQRTLEEKQVTHLLLKYEYLSQKVIYIFFNYFRKKPAFFRKL